MTSEKEYVLKFYTAEYDERAEKGDVFGCASLGLVTENEWILPDIPASRNFGMKVKGILVNDDYDNARREIDEIRADIKGGIVFFGNCGSENDFMRYLNDRFPGIPFAGGSPAIGADGRVKRMLPDSKQVDVLLITDERYDISCDTVNVYGETIDTALITKGGIRSIESIRVNGQSVDFYNYMMELKNRMGIDEGLTERVAVSDMNGRNIHLIEEDGSYVCGTDLPGDGKITIRYTTRENVLKLMERFYSAPDSLVFGCAGVKSNLGDSSFKTGRNSLGMFMFGEVVSIEGCPADFANLMLTRLSFNKIF